MILNNTEIEQLKKNAQIHQIIINEIKKIAKPWVSTFAIDNLCWEICQEHWYLPWFKWVYNFPANMCISINDVVVHWVPSKSIILQDWDLVKFDLWVKDKNIGINTDAAFAMIIWDWPKNKEIERFVKVNKDALYKWIDQCIIWNRVWDIWFAIQKHVESAWFHIVRDLTWHWLWYKLHDKPYIYNYGKPWTWEKLKKWMLLAIEPIIGFKSWKIIDKWWFEYYIADWSLWCQFEHTVLITEKWPEIII